MGFTAKGGVLQNRSFCNTPFQFFLRQKSLVSHRIFLSVHSVIGQHIDLFKEGGQLVRLFGHLSGQKPGFFPGFQNRILHGVDRMLLPGVVQKAGVGCLGKSCVFHYHTHQIKGGQAGGGERASGFKVGVDKILCGDVFKASLYLRAQR